ncbi:MAG: energy-dependent translational throttle protein EttA, partial [Gemmataceae bacterium]|nr:energy-dependent translational throttle protein EttA [Gemmataceae bacterium]
MGEKYVYTISRLTKHYGKKEVLKDINLAFYPGAKIGVIGSNGAGKSTLLRIMAGADKEFMGEAWADKGATVGYVPQEPHLTPGKTVLENVEEAVAHIRALLKKQEEIGEAMGDPDADFEKLSDQMERVQARIDAADAYNLDRQLELAMDAMRLPPSDAPVERLSGGERRRVALCKTLLQRHDLLLLDEPTNHLDAESVEWLEHHLESYPGAVVAVTHDRYFLDNVAKWILELDYGRGYPWSGNYSGWLDQKRRRLAVEERQESARQKALARELEWAKSSPRARMAKSKARLAAIDKLREQVIDEDEKELTIQIPAGPPLGDLVVRAEGVKKAYGENLLYDDLTFDLPKGGIVGIIGPNGAGKTTLFKMIVGQEQPDGGTLTVGPTVKPAHVDQNRDALNDKNTIFEEVTGGTDYIMLGKQRIASRAYCAKFNFRG